jgi:oxygen-independent coproporphyrinogen-3 oxidase
MADLEPSPDAPELADAATGWRSAYLHIPFCARRCPYCDFAVVAADEGGNGTTSDRYVAALHDEIAMEEPWEELDAINFGGGTPSRLPVSQIDGLLSALRSHFGIAPHAEVSIEVNPEDWSEPYASAARAAGVTRVSLGVQSFDQDVLDSLGRQHTPDQARVAVGLATDLDFSTNLDLIYGTPSESAMSWAATIETALSFEPDHLSAYALTVEPGTELFRAIRSGAPRPDPDDQADKWTTLANEAEAAGLVRYEVSNYARPGEVCRYNLSTWAAGEYVAFGLGAHGHRDGVRRRNVRGLDRYLEAVERGERPEAGREELDAFERDRERVMLGLRRTAGVVAGVSGTALLGSEEGTRLLEARVLESRGDRLVVRQPLLTDVVVRSVLSVEEPQR